MDREELPLMEAKIARIQTPEDEVFVVPYSRWRELILKESAGGLLALKILELISRWHKSPDDDFPLEDLSNEEQKEIIRLARRVLGK